MIVKSPQCLAIGAKVKTQKKSLAEVKQLK